MSYGISGISSRDCDLSEDKTNTNFESVNDRDTEQDAGLEHIQIHEAIDEYPELELPAQETIHHRHLEEAAN